MRSFTTNEAFVERAPREFMYVEEMVTIYFMGGSRFLFKVSDSQCKVGTLYFCLSSVRASTGVPRFYKEIKTSN